MRDVQSDSSNPSNEILVDFGIRLSGDLKKLSTLSLHQSQVSTFSNNFSNTALLPNCIAAKSTTSSTLL